MYWEKTTVVVQHRHLVLKGLVRPGILYIMQKEFTLKSL